MQCQQTTLDLGAKLAAEKRDRDQDFDQVCQCLFLSFLLLEKLRWKFFIAMLWLWVDIFLIELSPFLMTTDQSLFTHNYQTKKHSNFDIQHGV